MPVTSILSELQASIHNTDTSSCVDSCIRNWKIGFAAILSVEGLLFAHIVYLFRSWKSFDKDSTLVQKVKHYGNAMSSGIFLSAGLLHLLPEAVELFEGHSHGAEEEGEEHDEEEGEEHSEEEGEEEEVEFPWAFFVIMVSYYAVLAIERVIIPRLIGTTSCDLEEYGHKEVAAKLETASTEETEEKVAPAGLRSPEFVRGLTRVLALSLHSLVECMALGLTSSFSTTLNIFIALVSHRWATAISIAFNLAWTMNYLPFLILVMVFTLTVPIGVGIGAALTGLNATAQGVFFAISTATFIYLGAFAGVSEELIEHTPWLVRKFGFMLFGASIISVITGILAANDIHG